MLLQFPLLRNNALKNATCRQNEPFNEEHQDLSAEQFRQMMFQVGVYLEAGDTLLEKSKGEKQIEKSPVRRSLLVGGGPNVISVLLLVARKDQQESTILGMEDIQCVDSKILIKVKQVSVLTMKCMLSS